MRTLATAGPRDLSFLTHARYREAALRSEAAALLIGVEESNPEAFECEVLIAEDPYLALARILAHLHPQRKPEPGVHQTAVVASDAVIDPSAHVGAYAVIGSETVLGAGVIVHSHVAIGRECHLAEECEVHPHVSIYDRTQLGPRCIVHSGAVLGADGFGYASAEGARVKLPQVGRVVLEADVEVGANSAIDRATLDETRVGAGTKIDNLVQVGHNVVTGKGCILCGQAGISGSTTLGDGVVMGGQTGASGHLRIGNGVQVAGKSAVFQSIEDGQVIAGVPAQSIGQWRRQVSGLNRLAELRRRVRNLEKRAGGAMEDEGLE